MDIGDILVLMRVLSILTRFLSEDARKEVSFVDGTNDEAESSSR